LADQVTSYKCPSCGAPLKFGGASDKLECEYCGSTFTVEYIEELYAPKDDSAAQAQEDADAAAAKEQEETSWQYAQDEWDGEAEGVRVYNCDSCGAELICDETTAATFCPYCGNSTIVPGQLTGALKPELVIPFRIGKDEALSALKNFYKGKKLLPRAFSNSNHLEKIQGVYVPFWLYDGQAEGHFGFQGVRILTTTSGKYRITTSEYFDIRRGGTVDFEKIPVDASSKMPDNFMDAIEPYDYSELKPFSTAYLPGYLADKYDVSAEDCEERADKRASASTESALTADVAGYDKLSIQSGDVQLRRGQVHYALLPVWLLSTRWNERNYLFAVNGQTGRLVGDLPISKGRLAAWFFGVWAAVAAILLFLLGTFVF